MKTEEANVKDDKKDELLKSFVDLQNEIRFEFSYKQELLYKLFKEALYGEDEDL